MATKTRRIETRVDPASEQRIAEAAALTHESVSAFVLRAARSEADRVLAHSDATMMPAEQFDALLHSLDEPDDAPGLTRLASSDRVFTRG